MLSLGPSPDRRSYGILGGRVSVHAQRDGERLKITIADTGTGTVENIKARAGLGALRERLAVLFGEAGRLTFENNERRGIKAVLEAPFVQGAEST